ncbi:MAG TPA: S8 family serine peptidase [Bryobacteraceae bacterium]|nr:S8 family serine peptidase [Bryobacteraceae bacterium]
MIRRLLLIVLLISTVWVSSARATTRLIVRVNGGLPVIQSLCLTLGCTVQYNLDGTLGQVFLVTSSDLLGPSVNQGLSASTDVADLEPDLLAQSADSTYTIPPALSDTTPVNYFGSAVADGYVNQRPYQIVRAASAQTTFALNGTGTAVAVIDTGIDPNHPVLQSVLVPGYDFTRNQAGEADETQDLNLSSQPDMSNPQLSWLSSTLVANLSQSTVAVVDGGGSQTSDFGHGTMVAGVIHLVAPEAKIMPLKAFRADGTGYTSDILRALYWAVRNNANVVNMSFNLAAYSPEVKNAVDYAANNGVICVAAAGNKGQQILVYPAALSNVIGVASTTNTDQRSSFSNYGQGLVWVAAPGEGVVTTYPFGTYAAGWGTSFSTPFVSGTAALMLSVGPPCLPSQARQAIANAQPLTSDLGNGRLDTYLAVQSWRAAVGMQ